MKPGLTHMAHFVRKFPLRVHRTIKYGSLAVLNFRTNCTHVRKSWKNIAYLAVLAVGVMVFAGSPTVGAETVRIQPLQMQTSLKKGEKQKSFVDITNPAAQEVELSLYVHGFKQVNDKGSLTFFDSKQLAAGIKLDYDSVKLGAHQTLRLYFLVDGTKLPTGDIFAVIFAESVPTKRPGTNTAVRVGSLLMVTNQTPGSRKAEITRLDVPFVQIGDSVRGEIAVKNPVPAGQATGFFPEMKIELKPWGGSRSFAGPLIFAGNTRTFGFTIPSDLFGIYTVTVRANQASKTTYVFLITGWWRIAAPILVILLIGAASLLWKWRHPRRRIHLKHHHS